MLAKKQNLKRVFSSFLALIMLLGLLPTSAFAAGTSGKIEYQKEEWTYSADGKVAHKKTIEKTGENQFEITLNVKTMEEVKEQVVSPDAAVVLVMDVSNSMKETVDGKQPDTEEEQRIYKAKEAAKNFIDSFAADAGNAKRQVSIVEFGSSAYTVQGWTDAASAKNAVDNLKINFQYPACTIQGSHTHDVNTIEWSGFFGLQWRCNVKDCKYYKKDTLTDLNWFTLFERGYEGHTHEQSFDGPHGDTMRDGGGTNIEGGLQLADNLLNSSAVSGIGNRYVVLITDGIPTYHTYKNRDNSSMTFIEGQSGGGNYAARPDYENVPNVANAIKEDATLYTVSYASGYVKETVGGMKIDAWLSSFANKNVAAGENIDWGLGQISEIIQNQSKAWILTDPIPAANFITFSFDDNANIPDHAVNPDSVFSYDKEKGQLIWNLKGETPVSSEQEGNTTWYTYEATYTIRLDTAAQGFVEDKAYDTNGTTTLTYMLTENGELQPDLKSTDLVVPKVSGKTPVVNYTINYLYKDKESGEYVNGKTTPGSGKLWSTITIDSGAYSKENYRFKEGLIGVQTLTADGLVFNLYYDPITANVVVNHYVSTITKTDNGEVYSDPELKGTDQYPNLYQGDKFTNESFLDNATYKQVDSVTVDNTTYTTDNYTNITLPEGTTTINIYYTTTGEDQRTPVEYEIHYWYREDSWQLNADGKYEKVTGTYVENTEVAVKAQDYHGVTVNATDKAGGDYQLDTEKTPSTSMKLDKNGTNRLDIYYYKDAPTEPSDNKATLTIKHVYKQETISGVTEVEADNWTECENKTVYVGETWAATPDTKDGYTLKTLASDFTVTITEVGKHYEIVVEYYKDVREPVDIVINHYYTTYTWTVDPVTGEGEYKVTGTDELLGVHPAGPEVWYVGQTYKPEQISNGYTYKSGGDAAELTSGTNTFDLYYETYVGSEADEADVTVNHIYTTYRSYVDADGNVVLNEASSKTESEDTHYGMKGDTFTAKEQEKDGFTFVKADTDDLLVTLQGEGGQYNLYYEKSVNDLGDPYGVTVQPVYKTYTQHVNSEGKIVTELTNTENGTPVELSGDFYANQKVTVLAADYGKDGFTYDSADEANSGLTITVSATGENVITIVYSKTDSEVGLPVAVMVNNVYTTVTKYSDENGVVKTKESSFTSGSTTYYPYYVGQFFDTTGKGTQLPGYVEDTREGITQPAASVKVEKDGQQITFYWLQEVDQTVPATVKVVHHYTINDKMPGQSREWTVGADDEPLTGYFAGQTYKANYDFQNDFDASNVTAVVPEGAATDPGIKLVAGLNEIHIYYELNRDSRPESSAKVIHNYYKDAKALEEGTTEATYEENITDLKATNSYTATLRLENQELPYTFHSATPEEYTITVDKDAEKNVITINYLRTDTYYVVNHTYYLDGELQGTVTDEPVPAKVGDVVTAESIEKKTTYKDNSYEYVSADKESITLGADGAYNVITLRYEGSTSIGPSVTRYDLVVKYLEQGTEKELANTYRTTVRRGNDYDATSRTEKEIDGYVIVDVTGDAVKGTMNGDKEIIVWYEADDNEIVDPETPLNPDPGTDPDDGNNNPGDGGETDIGDPETPLNPDPGTGDGTGDGAGNVPGDGGETDIGDGETPMGDLPQTGMTAAPVNPTVTVGLVALAMSMASLGLFFTFGRKKGEEED